MPYKTTWEQHGIYWQFSDIVTELDIIDANKEMYKDARFSSIHYFIWDATNTKSIDLSNVQVDLEAVKAQGESIRKNELKCAFIATDETIKELINQYITTSNELNSTWEFMLFNDIEGVRKWVDFQLA